MHNLKIFERLNQPEFMNDIYLLTGGNMGDRRQFLQTTVELIGNRIGKVMKASSIYETAAWGFTEQAAFLNQVLNIHSTLPPHDLLLQLLDIEMELGRKRVQKMGPELLILIFYFIMMK